MLELNWHDHWIDATGRTEPIATEPFEWANETAINLLVEAGCDPDDEATLKAQAYLTLAFIHVPAAGDKVQAFIQAVNDHNTTAKHKESTS